MCNFKILLKLNPKEIGLLYVCQPRVKVYRVYFSKNRELYFFTGDRYLEILNPGSVLLWS